MSLAALIFTILDFTLNGLTIDILPFQDSALSY